MQARRDRIARIVDGRMGWDITDYGAGRFDEMGLFLFTLRNGGRRTCNAAAACATRKSC